MGVITWTKSWSASDNGTIFGGADLQNIQGDITTVVNGGLTNANVNASAAIAESKLAFDTSAGHDHDGSNSKSIALTVQHYRRGFTLFGTSDTVVNVAPGVIELDGTVYSDETNTALTLATDGDWITGTSGAGASTWAYVYAYNNSGTIDFKLHTAAPNLSDDTNATGPIFRYLKVSTVLYRCLGTVFQDADGDLCWGQASSEGEYYSNFDASNTMVIAGKGTGADQSFKTLWTPKYVHIIYGDADTTPAVDDDVNYYTATQRMLDTTWYATQLNAQHNAALHDWRAVSDAGSINTITAQAAGTAGSFTIDAMVDGTYFYAIATTDEL